MSVAAVQVEALRRFSPGRTLPFVCHPTHGRHGRLRPNARFAEKRRRNCRKQLSASQKRWGGRRDSNPRRPESQSGALPAELRPPSSVLPPRNGAPGRNRTCNRRLRRPVLYPVELRAPRKTVLGAPNVNFQADARVHANRIGSAQSYPIPAALDEVWSGQRDSNPRPSGPKPDALPDCAMPRAAPPGYGGDPNRNRSAHPCNAGPSAPARRHAEKSA